MRNPFETEAILLSGSAETPSTRGHLQRTESEAANRSILTSPSRLHLRSGWSFTFHYARQKDSSNLKICGQGEWHAKKHGERWRKRWKKLHIGVDENGRILAYNVTDGHEHDPSQVPNLLIQVDREIERFVGDEIYDKEAVYEAVGHHSPGAEVVVPPKKDAVLSNNSIRVSSQRDCHIAEVRSKGRSEWKRQSGYYLQSHAENAFYRYKRIIGGRLRAKNEDAQKREAAIGCAILNRMREMGEPLSYAVG